MVIGFFALFRGGLRLLAGLFFAHFGAENTIFSFGNASRQIRSVENITVSFFLFPKGGLMRARNENEERKAGKKERAGGEHRVARTQ